MATITWKQNPAVAEALAKETPEFEFEQAITILEQTHTESEGLGEGSDPARESVEIKSHISLAAPATELYRLQTKPGQKKTLWINFLSLAGIQGPLPTPYTELVIQRNRQKDFAFRDFLDIFNHRLASLWYRFRKKLKVGLSPVLPEEHPIGKTLLQLVGIQQTPAFKDCLQSSTLTSRVLLSYHDLLWHRSHSAAGLVCLLGSYFQVPVSLELFQGRWREPHPDDFSYIGYNQGKYHALGQTMVLGKKVWDQAAGMTIVLGPLKWDAYQSFLPVRSGKDNPQFKLLRELSYFYHGLEFSLRLRLLLKKEEARPLALNGQFALGWNSWMYTKSSLSIDGHVDIKIEPL